MSRVIKINKVGKATIIEVVDNALAVPEVYMVNKLTNVILRDNVLDVKIEEVHLFIKYDEIENKLASTDLKDYLNKAAALFLFNQ